MFEEDPPIVDFNNNFITKGQISAWELIDALES
jgi:hypothetical protein